MSFFISQALAEAPAGQPPGPSPMANIIMLVVFILLFYLILWRPQAKRAKEHRELVGGLAKGDEVVTNGGVVGKITGIADEFVVLEVAANVQITVQKVAIAASLPKGTLKSVQAA